MESNFQSTRERVRYKLTLDDYISFFDSNNHFDLTIDQLNQIIGIHGFKKLHKVPKNVLCEAVDSLELMDPCRSTLKDSQVSSCAVLTLDEVTKGLNDLGWQECCVTSLQMFNSVDIEADQLNAMAYSSNNTFGSSSRVKRSKRARKRRRLSDVESNFAGNEISAAAARDMNGRFRKRGDVESASHSYDSQGLLKLAPEVRRLSDAESNFAGNENSAAAYRDNNGRFRKRGDVESASHSYDSQGLLKLAPRRKMDITNLHDIYTNSILDTDGDRNWSVC